MCQVLGDLQIQILTHKLTKKSRIDSQLSIILYQKRPALSKTKKTVWII